MRHEAHTGSESPGRVAGAVPHPRQRGFSKPLDSLGVCLLAPEGLRLLLTGAPAALLHPVSLPGRGSGARDGYMGQQN